MSFICRRNLHIKKTTTLIFFVVISNIIESIIQLFLVSFSYSVFKYPYKIKVGRDLTNDPTSTLPTDWRRSGGQSREVATPGAHHK